MMQRSPPSATLTYAYRKVSISVSSLVEKSTGRLWVTIQGFFSIMSRLIVLVDGFNLYHSIRDIQHNFGVCLKWLDIYSLCKSYGHLVINDAQLVEVHYFTALATHLSDPTAVDRHKDYITCLEETGILVEYGRFKPKDIYCTNCKTWFVRHEEKETDVRIATKVCHLLQKDMCDAILLLTGDTDLTPSVEHGKQCFPEKTIRFAFPYGRASDELRQIAPGSFKINWKNYAKYQLPDPFPLSSGNSISKPSTW